MANARKIALKALLEVEQGGAYSNITIDRLLAQSNALPQDRALATALFYGVLDRRITLDWVLSNYTTSSLSKTGDITLAALRIALFQIMYMDRIPPSAAVNETVNIVKKSPERYNAAFVNAVLRNILRRGTDLPEPNTPEGISIVFSCPPPIVQSFIEDYGILNTVQLLEASLEAPPVTVRVNTLKTTADALAKRLRAEGVESRPAEMPDALHLDGSINLRTLKSYSDGLFHIQDLASQISVSRLAPKAGERVLDVCAAPGGKSFTMAELMGNKGSITALDIHPHRVELIANGAKRLGIDIISANCADATALEDTLGQFDAILCDVPCSGLGVIRRKPEIKYKDIDEFMALPELQLSILESAAKRLNATGRLLYSTCTLRTAENEATVRAFLDRNRGYELSFEHTFMPHTDGTDGFYCALIKKI